jgi:hypothetical protein
MFKKNLIHGLTSGVLSGFICFFFAKMLKDNFMYDFSSILTTVNLFGACVFGCILASIGFYGIKKLTPKNGDVIFNIVFTIFVFASLIFPMKHMLPFDFDQDLTMIFPTYAMTMHFFPALIWFAVKPIFIK